MRIGVAFRYKAKKSGRLVAQDVPGRTSSNALSWGRMCIADPATKHSLPLEPRVVSLRIPHGLMACKLGKSAAFDVTVQPADLYS